MLWHKATAHSTKHDNACLDVQLPDKHSALAGAFLIILNHILLQEDFEFVTLEDLHVVEQHRTKVGLRVHTDTYINNTRRISETE